MPITLLIFTLVHVLISLIGIGSGFVVMNGWFKSQRLDQWTSVFFLSTVLTSVTGFGFPFTKFLPSHAVGIISLVVLAVTIYARYPRKMAGVWRPVFVIGGGISQYLNCFVLVVQAFLKIPFLHALAPTQAEPPFAIVQGLVLVAFIVAIVLAAIRFRVQPNTQRSN